MMLRRMLLQIVATALGASWRSTYFALQHARHSKMGLPINPDYYLHLGPLCVIFRDAYRNGPNLAACERVGLSDYVVAHHITDMYHHRNFRGAYTKTLTPSGTGDIAERLLLV